MQHEATHLCKVVCQTDEQHLLQKYSCILRYISFRVGTFYFASPCIMARCINWCMPVIFSFTKIFYRHCRRTWKITVICFSQIYRSETYYSTRINRLAKLYCAPCDYLSILCVTAAHTRKTWQVAFKSSSTKLKKLRFSYWVTTIATWVPVVFFLRVVNVNIFIVQYYHYVSWICCHY